MSLSLQQLARALELEFRGDAEHIIEGVASLESAAVSDLCFIQHKRLLPVLESSSCAAVILPPDLADSVDNRSVLISDNPQHSFVEAIHLLDLAPAEPVAGIHPSAQIATSARLGDGVSVGALAIIGDQVEVGPDSTIGAGSVLEQACRVGDSCLLHSRVTLGRGVVIGDRCILHSGAVIGADGFGLVMQQDRWRKIPQLGGVVIEDDVEIGANTTVDRGALDDTVIEQGCKLDNQIQVAHNVRIGAHTAIAACVGIAGSARIGRYCKISGGVGILGHLSVADHVTVTAMSLVTGDIKEPGVYSSGTPLMENSLWHRNNVRYKSLDKIARSLARLEKSKS